jgi:hypothetical protein
MRRKKKAGCLADCANRFSRNSHEMGLSAKLSTLNSQL